MKMIFKQIAIGLVLVSGACTSWAEASAPYGISVTQLINKTNETNDTTYLSISLKRCAAMLNLVNGILLRDTGEARFPEATEKFLAIAEGLDGVKAQERGANSSRGDIISRVSEEYTRHREQYLQWMTTNYDEYGDYWGSDPVMADELDSCKMLLGAIGK